MSRSARALFSSSFIYWILFALVSCYFLFAVRAPRGDESFFSRIHMPRIKLGIDLQGGTYLVLGVGLEKAIENRLTQEKKYIEELFEKEKLGVKPDKAALSGNKVIFSFPEDENARTAYHFMRKHMPALAVKNNGQDLAVSLSPQDEQSIRAGVVDQAVNVLQNRLNGFGVSGLLVQRHGERQVVVQLPGLDDPERVKALITKSAMLEFKIVEKEGSQEELLDAYDGDLPSDKMIVFGQKGEKSGQAYLVNTYADVTGDHISDARITYDEYGRIQVAFSLDSTGAREFKALTGDNIGRHLGIVIDNVMYSAPVINSVISSNGVIQGNYSAEEARDLALVLRSGALKAPLTFEQENRVGASLGQDSIERGLFSCLIGLFLVLCFSIFYYGILGFFAMCALVYNLLLILLLMSYFEWTLTLPGIAGLVLTIGMAIDASILIYEKIREDLAAGTGSFRQAVQSGFAGAMVVILDSNITTFLTGFILFKFGGPAIKGFAVTLMTGIIATVAAGVFFLRALINFALDLRGGKPFKL